MDTTTLSYVKFLIPIVKRLRDWDESESQEWPEGYCAETSALINESLDAIMCGGGFKPQCGKVKNPCSRSGSTNHIWTRKNGINIDFTGHQFKALAGSTVLVDGFEVIAGSDEYFDSLGYIFLPPSQCDNALEEASMMNAMHGIS